MNFKYIKQLAARQELILGSSSPRRVRLLTELGVDFRQIIPQILEAIKPGETPCEYSQRLAIEKSQAVGARTGKGQIVFACDTIVVHQDSILEKPVDREDAERILLRLSGEMHVVCSAIALLGRGEVLAQGYETTEVYFNQSTPREIRKYIDTGEPMDKAGAYGIQGKGAFLVDSIKGNLDNVIGLPRHLFDKLAKETLGLLKLCD